MLLHEHPEYPDYLRIIADEKKIRDAILEKDYWVTYVLHELRKHSKFHDLFIFKGGTSLSKGWNLIDRFSEDIDLLLVKNNLGKKAKKSEMKAIEDFIGTLPGLTYDQSIPGNRSGPESRTSCYKYKSITPPEALGSLLPYIKLEMGYRGGIEPTEIRKIQSIVGEFLHNKGQSKLARNTGNIEIPLLHPKRTFVEKLFAIHSAYESGEIIGKIRHYYDVYKLLELSEVIHFIGTEDFNRLKNDVATFSKENWPDSPIPAKNNFSKSTAFNPPKEDLARIEAEYNRSDIYYGSKPQFKTILTRLQTYSSRF